MSGTNIELPTYKPTKTNVIHLVGTDEDLARGGGSSNNHYKTFSLAYSAAIAIASVSNKVVIKGYQITAAEVGNLSLTTVWNSNVSLVGESPFTTEFGSITIANATGNQTSTFPIISSCKIGAITTSGSGAIVSGNVVMNIDDCIITSIITSGPAAAGGSVTINLNSLTGLCRNSYIGAITTGGVNQIAGAVTISDGPSIKIGTLTTANGTTSSGGAISITGISTIGAIVAQSFSGSSALSFTNINSVGAITHNSAGGGLFITNSNLNGALNSNMTSGTFAIVNSMATSSITYVGIVGCAMVRSYFQNSVSINVNNASLTNNIDSCLFNTTVNINSTSAVRATNTSFIGQLNNFNGSSTFKSCLFSSTLTGIVPISGLGGQFFDCSFSVLTNVFTATSNCYIEASACSFATSNISAGTVAVRTEKEHVFSVQTTDSTTTALATIPIPTGQRLRFIANITATSGNDAMMAVIVNIFKNNSGTVVKIGSFDENEINAISDASLTAIVVAFAVSGTNAILNVTGILATTINWNVSIKAISSF